MIRPHCQVGLIPVYWYFQQHKPVRVIAGWMNNERTIRKLCVLTRFSPTRRARLHLLARA